MGLLDRLLGREKTTPTSPHDHESGTRPVAMPATEESLADAGAIDRYRYMVKTAPPDAVEQAHAEAFARLTAEQRRRVLAELANAAPPEERAAADATSPDDARAMGRLATRTELRQPGFMERTFGGGIGAGLGGSLLGPLAMGFLGSMVAQSFFSSLGDVGGAKSFDDDPTDPDMETDLDDADIDDTDMGGGDFDV